MGVLMRRDATTVRPLSQLGWSNVLLRRLISRGTWAACVAAPAPLKTPSRCRRTRYANSELILAPRFWNLPAPYVTHVRELDLLPGVPSGRRTSEG